MNQIDVTKHSESHYTIRYRFGNQTGIIEQLSGEEAREVQDRFYDMAQKGEITEVAVLCRTENLEETRMKLKKELGYQVLKILHHFGAAEVKTNFGRYWK